MWFLFFFWGVFVGDESGQSWSRLKLERTRYRVLWLLGPWPCAWYAYSVSDLPVVTKQPHQNGNHHRSDWKLVVNCNRLFIMSKSCTEYPFFKHRWKALLSELSHFLICVSSRRGCWLSMSLTNKAFFEMWYFQERWRKKEACLFRGWTVKLRGSETSEPLPKIPPLCRQPQYRPLKCWHSDIIFLVHI